jgi:subtilisin family serine protease
MVTAIMALNIPFNLKTELNEKNSAHVFVNFKGAVDWKSYENTKGVKFDDMEEIYRGKLVMNMLKDAAKCQEKVISYLNQNGIKFHRHIISNAISLKKADFGLLSNLESKFPEIASFELVDTIQLPDEKPSATFYNKSKADIEAGVQWVKAPEVWAKGTRGRGVVVGVIDTGAHLHKDLKDFYRGRNDNSHAKHWLDTVGNRAAPYDDHFHGTHCHGTVSAHSTSRKVGVAPQAEWISCKFLNSRGGGNLADAVRCFEFMLAPGGDSSLKANIVSNSWGGGSATAAMINALNAMAAAGILNVFAAGNSGNFNRCSSVLNPALINESFSVGALNRNANTLASFSSKGPGNNRRVKPEISAPGVSVVSTSNIGDGYRTASGTSMACPHVAGVAALLWSSSSLGLKGKVQETRKLLQDSATDVPNTTSFCPSETRIPNNFFGWGSVNALAAYEQGLEKRLNELVDALSK